MEKIEKIIITEDHKLIGYNKLFTTVGILTGNSSTDVQGAEFNLKKVAVRKNADAIIKCETIETIGQTVVLDSNNGLSGAKAKTSSTKYFTIRGEGIRFNNE